MLSIEPGKNISRGLLRHAAAIPKVGRRYEPYDSMKRERKNIEEKLNQELKILNVDSEIRK